MPYNPFLPDAPDDQSGANAGAALGASAGVGVQQASPQSVVDLRKQAMKPGQQKPSQVGAGLGASIGATAGAGKNKPVAPSRPKKVSVIVGGKPHTIEGDSPLSDQDIQEGREAILERDNPQGYSQYQALGNQIKNSSGDERVRLQIQRNSLMSTGKASNSEADDNMDPGVLGSMYTHAEKFTGMMDEIINHPGDRMRKQTKDWTGVPKQLADAEASFWDHYHMGTGILGSPEDVQSAVGGVTSQLTQGVSQGAGALMDANPFLPEFTRGPLKTVANFGAGIFDVPNYSIVKAATSPQKYFDEGSAMLDHDTLENRIGFGMHVAGPVGDVLGLKTHGLFPGKGEGFFGAGRTNPFMPEDHLSSLPPMQQHSVNPDDLVSSWRTPSKSPTGGKVPETGAQPPTSGDFDTGSTPPVQNSNVPNTIHARKVGTTPNSMGPKETGISNAAQEELVRREVLKSAPGGKGMSRDQMNNMVAEQGVKVDSGEIHPDHFADGVANGSVPYNEEAIATAQAINARFTKATRDIGARLDEAIGRGDQELIDKLQEDLDASVQKHQDYVDKIQSPLKTKWSNIGRLMGQMMKDDVDTFTGYLTSVKRKLGVDISPESHPEVYNQVKEAGMEVERAKADVSSAYDLQERMNTPEFVEEKATKEFKKMKTGEAPTGQTREARRTEFQAVTKNSWKNIQEKWSSFEPEKKLSGYIDPIVSPHIDVLSQKLAHIAPDVIEIAKAYTKYVGGNLAELVNHIQTRAKENGLDLSDNDIHRIVSGEFKQARETKISEWQARKQEAKDLLAQEAKENKAKIAKLEKDTALEGHVKPGTPKERTPKQIELAAEKKRAKDLAKEAAALDRHVIGEDKDFEESYKDSIKGQRAGIYRKMDEVNKQIQDKRTTGKPMVKKPKPYVDVAITPEMERLAKARIARDKLSATLEATLNPKSIGQTIVDHQRAMMLSGYHVLGKLQEASSAGGVEQISDGLFTRPMKNVLGLRDSLGTEAHSSLEAGKQSIAAALWKGDHFDTNRWVDSLKKLTTGENEIGMKRAGYGIPSKEALMPEIDFSKFKDPKSIATAKFLHSVQNIILRTEYRIHGAFKTGRERGAFASEMTKLMELNQKHGLGMSDEALFHASYEAGKRAIFMSDSKATKFVSKALNIGGEFKPLRILEPFAKVATNFSMRSGEYVGGLPYAVWLRLHHASNMTPAIEQEIMRAAKRGAVGIALGTWILKGTTSKDVSTDKYNNLIIRGWKVPPYLAHVPSLMAIIAAVNYRDAGGNILHKALSGGMKTAEKFGEEFPLTGAAMKATDIIKSGDRASKKLGDIANTFLAPQLTKDLAKDTDKHERQPKNFMDSLKMGYPGLRETVQQK